MGSTFGMTREPSCKRCGKELQWYWEYWAHDDIPYCGDEPIEFTPDKSLTAPELSAEYHAQDAWCNREQWIETCQGDDYTERERVRQKAAYEKANTLYRFATLPHYYEEQP